MGWGQAKERQGQREIRPWVSSICFSTSHYFQSILTVTIPADKSIVLKDLQELMNQSWEYNQFKDPSKQGNETEALNARG